MSYDKKVTFLIGELDGEFAAIRTEEPRFCIVGPTKQQVTDTALRAWSFYLEAEADHPVTVTKVFPMRDIRKDFRARETVLATG